MVNSGITYTLVTCAVHIMNVAGGGYGMVPGGLRRASDTTLLARAQSMSEAAGFQAPPELINAMELLAGEAPYPAPADMSGKGTRNVPGFYL
jgi:hypothetical protein